MITFKTTLKSFSLFHLLVIFLVLLTILPRIYQLGEIPSILNPDEASIAYNAFLLNETGKDEWGKESPIILEAFGDQKPFVYPYLTVLSFKLFGYHDWSVRLTAVIAGVLIVWQAYRIGKIFLLTKYQSLGLAFIVSSLPIFIFYSRVAYEAMVALVLTLEIILLTYPQRKKQFIYDLIAITLSAIAYFTYNAPFLIIPLLIVPIIFIRGILHWKKWFPLIIFMIIVWLSSYVTLSAFTAQKSQITIFSQIYYVSEYIEYRLQYEGISQTILGNKYVFYAKEVFSNYVNSFSPDFLLRNKDGHPWHTVPTTGYIYLTIYVMGMSGLVWLVGTLMLDLFRYIKFKYNNQSKKYKFQHQNELLIIYVLLVSLFPASITVNAPHATRTLLFYILFPLISVKGLHYFAHLVQKNLSHFQDITKGILIVFTSVVLIESVIYYHTYFVVYKNSPEMQDVFMPGYSDMLHSSKVVNSKPNIAVIDESGFQYILTAWYLKMPATEYFSTIVKQQPDTINFKYGEQVGSYRFIKSPSDRFDHEKYLIRWDGDTWQLDEF